MKKTYVTPESELQFILTQDIVTSSVVTQLFSDVKDRYESDYTEDEWYGRNS